MIVTGQVSGDDKVLAFLGSVPDRVKGEIQLSVGRLVLLLKRKVQAEKLSGQVLKVQTNNLRGSISSATEFNDRSASGIVSTNVVYARIHEYGGVIRAHVVEAKKKQALSFMWGGKRVAFKRVTIPEVKMPERSFLRSALAEMEPEIKREFAAACNRALQGGSS